MQLTPYICGPLTELSRKEQAAVKNLYTNIADVCEQVIGVRGFVPHEYFDPIKNAAATPAEVNAFERDQVCNRTSALIVVALAPSWGGGIEVEMAYRSNVPVLLICEKEKLAKGRISRLLRGNPAIKEMVEFANFDDLLKKIRPVLEKTLCR